MNRSERQDWHFVPDACLERILLHLPPRSIASLRLVSRSWKDQVSHTLAKLALESGCNLETVPLVFPNLGTLSFTFDRSGAPSLVPLLQLRSLLNITLRGPDPRPQAVPIALGSSALVEAAACPRLTALSLVRVALPWTCPELGGLVNLTKLHISGVKFTLTESRGASKRPNAISNGADFCSMLGTLRHLECLEIDEATALHRGNNTSIEDDTSFALRWVEAISRLKYLKRVRLGGIVPITDDIWAVLASLPRLSSLHISLPEIRRNTAPAGHFGPNAGNHGVEHSGLALLKARAGTLQRLVLHGCPPAASLTVPHIAALTSLTSLELCTIAEEEIPLIGGAPMMPVEARHPCWGRLAPLHRLQELYLGGWPLGTAAARALSRIPSLTSLKFENCWNLADGAAFELAKMAGLRYFGLRQCTAISDIGLAALAKGRSGRILKFLDLNGCHKNVTDQGIAALHGMPSLERIDLSHCDLISDAGLEAALPGLRRLKHLFLSDTQVSDYGCSIIVSYAPALCSLALEHCPKVTDRGASALSGLPDLQKVRAFGSSITPNGAHRLAEKTGAELILEKPCWWSREGHVTSPPV